MLQDCRAAAGVTAGIQSGSSLCFKSILKLLKKSNSYGDAQARRTARPDRRKGMKTDVSTNKCVYRKMDGTGYAGVSGVWLFDDDAG